MSLGYPDKTIWYVQASTLDGKDVSEGSAVAIRLQKRDEPKTAKTYLLTCSHVVRGTSARRRVIRAWPPDAAYNDRQAKDVEVDADFKELATVGLSPAECRNAADDWIILEIHDPQATMAASAVGKWAGLTLSGNFRICGYVGGADSFPRDKILPTLTPDTFPLRDVSLGAVYLTGHGTRPGLSGGGVFGEADLHFAGIHRARFDETLQLCAVSSFHIRQRLYELGYEPAPHLPDTDTGSQPPQERPRTPNGAEPQLGDPTADIPTHDWGNAPLAPCFFGRRVEIEDLRKWILGDDCQVIAIVGLGGVGKTHLLGTLREGGVGKTDLSLELARQIQGEFDRIVWKSLRSKRDAADVLGDVLASLGRRDVWQAEASVTARIDRMMEWFRRKRCLVIFDNFESILGGPSGPAYEVGCEGFGELLRRAGEERHRSCLLLTSREKPPEVSELEGPERPVRTLSLVGLDLAAARQLCAEEASGALEGSDQDWEESVRHYDGNPLALKLMAKHIRDVHGGKLSDFVKVGLPQFQRIGELLSWHFNRLGPREKELMYWLAINEEPVSLLEIKADLRTDESRRTLSSTVESLLRKLPLDRSSASQRVTLQAVVLEFVTDHLVQKAYQELVTGTTRLFDDHALLKAQSSEFVRAGQARLILDPILNRFEGDGVATTARRCLDHVLAERRKAAQAGRAEDDSYAVGNALNLLAHRGEDVRGLDLAGVTVRQARLDAADLVGVSFRHAHLDACVFQQDFSAVMSVAFHPRVRSRLAASDSAGSVSLWDVPSGKQLLCLKGHNNYVMSVAFSPDGERLVSGSYDRTVRTWDLRTGLCDLCLNEHQGWVLSATFSPDGSYVASAGEKGVIILSDARTGRCVRQMQADGTLIWSLVFTADGSALITGSHDGTVRAWDVQTGQCRHSERLHNDAVRGVAAGEDGLVASGSYDGKVKVIDPVSWATRHTLTVDMGGVWSLLFGPHDGQITCAGADGSLRVWDIESGKCDRVMLGHTNWIVKAAVSPDRAMFATAGNDRTVRYWDANNGRCLNVLRGYTNYLFSLAVHEGTGRVAAGYEDGGVRIWDLAQGRRWRLLEGHKNWVLCVAWDTPGRWVASGGYEPHVRIWDLRENGPARKLEGHGQWVSAVVFSPDGKLLASAGYDKEIRLWDFAVGRCVRVLRGHEDWVWSLAFDRTGQTLASASNDNTARLWRAADGSCRAVLTGHGSRVRSVAVGPQGDVLASASYDHTIRFWDLQTGTCLKTLLGHTNWVMSIAFREDGRLLASASYDGTVRLWDVNSGKCKEILEVGKRIESVAFSSDGSTLFYGGADGAISLWDLGNMTAVRQFREPRPYEGMDVTGATGLTEAQMVSLRALGAIETDA